MSCDPCPGPGTCGLWNRSSGAGLPTSGTLRTRRLPAMGPQTQSGAQKRPVSGPVWAQVAGPLVRSHPLLAFAAGIRAANARSGSKRRPGHLRSTVRWLSTDLGRPLSSSGPVASSRDRDERAPQQAPGGRATPMRRWLDGPNGRTGPGPPWGVRAARRVGTRPSGRSPATVGGDGGAIVRRVGGQSRLGGGYCTDCQSARTSWRGSTSPGTGPVTARHAVTCRYTGYRWRTTTSWTLPGIGRPVSPARSLISAARFHRCWPSRSATPPCGLGCGRRTSPRIWSTSDPGTALPKPGVRLPCSTPAARAPASP